MSLIAPSSTKAKSPSINPTALVLSNFFWTFRLFNIENQEKLISFYQHFFVVWTELEIFRFLPNCELQTGNVFPRFHMINLRHIPISKLCVEESLGRIIHQKIATICTRGSELHRREILGFLLGEGEKGEK